MVNFGSPESGPDSGVINTGGYYFYLPSAALTTSVVFDPTARGRLYASVNEEGLYVSDDAGKTWRKDGLDGSAISRMRCCCLTSIVHCGRWMRLLVRLRLTTF